MMILGWFNATVFLLIALLHFYWVAGGQWGLRNAVPTQFHEHFFAAGMQKGIKWATLMVALGLIGFALANLWMIGALPKPAFLAPFLSYGILTIAAIFGIRGVGDFRMVGLFKADRSPGFAYMDSFFYSPLCLLLLTTHLWLFFG